MSSPSGNRCGHDPRRPRLQLQRPDNQTRGKPFPWLIRQALERIEGLYRERWRFRELGPRKRSERIEGMVLVAKALIRNLDILTMRAGRWREDGILVGISMKTIAKWAGISEQRAFRASWDLREAGWISISQPIEKTHEGPCGPGLCPRRGHKGRAAIRSIKRELFERLELRGRLMKERGKRAADARAATAQTIAQRRQIRRLVRASERARTLTTRTRDQLAGAATPPPPKQETIADMAARMLAAASDDEARARVAEWIAKNSK
jgi:hypothetical protein